jgi:hypothetical protein
MMENAIQPHLQIVASILNNIVLEIENVSIKMVVHKKRKLVVCSLVRRSVIVHHVYGRIPKVVKKTLV